MKRETISESYFTMSEWARLLDHIEALPEHPGFLIRVRERVR